MRRSLPAILALTLLLTTVATAAAQSHTGVGTAQRMAEAVRVAEPPTAATWRNPAAWGGAIPITDFIQQEPVEGAPASERTEVRIVYDDRAIYVGAWMFDGDAARIITGERRRDASLGQSDAFVVIFDTFHDLQNGFVFGTHPGGIEYDGQVINEGRGGGGGGRQQGGAGGGLNVNWDGSWTVQTDRDGAGWYAFFRIPFSTLRYGSDPEQTWGINFNRSIARKSEEVFWSPISRQYNLYRVSSAGVLTGLEVPARRVLTATPYVLGSAQRVPALHEGVRYPFEVGGDAKIGVTQGLTLDLTLNTYFAQVEVDEQQIDLTRFNLFFPEKRPFFLENAGLFAVGTNSSAQMFFSRRIGISQGGSPVPIQGGGRLTGRVGGVDVGLLNIRTDGLGEIQPPNQYSVARVSRQLGNRSQVGAIVTERAALGNRSSDYGRTYAVDGRLGLGESVTLSAVLGSTDRPGFRSSDEAIILSGEVRTRDWRVAAQYDQIGANFNPEVGFLRRSDFRAGGAQVMRYLRTPNVSWLRELRPHADYSASYSLDGFKETELIHLDVHVAWENGALFSPALDRVYDGLGEPFTVAPGIRVQPGRYSGWLWAPRFNTSTRSPVVFRTGADLGSFLSGNRRGGFGSVDFRQGSTLAGRLRLEHNRIELAEGAFDVTLAQGRLAYSFTPNLFIQSLLQYNSQSKVWSGNVRLGWLDTAGTGLFLVYNERQMVEGIAGPLERSLLVKFTRQFDLSGVASEVMGR